MTVLVLGGMLVLFSLNLLRIFGDNPHSPTYIRHNDVRGIAVRHEGLLYTLNFRQQNDVIDLLNRSVLLRELPTGQREDSPIEQIIIYRFGSNDLVLTPIAYINNHLVYSTSLENPPPYLMDLSSGTLKNLLSQTYDP